MSTTPIGTVDRKSTRDLNTWFELVVSTIDLAALLTFWFLGGFEALDHFIRGFHLPPVLNGLLYLGILCAGREALMLPFTIYHTFVIEQRYGFNRTTVGRLSWTG